MLFKCHMLALVGLYAVLWHRGAQAVLPTNFHNFTGCLYAYMDQGSYRISFPDAESQSAELPINKLEFDDKSTCATKDKTGNLIVNYALSDNYMTSMSLEFQVQLLPVDGFWTINKVTLKIEPSNSHLFPQKTIELKAPNEIYAADGYSFSCARLQLQNLRPAKDEPQFRIEIRRFQVQPFHEPSRTIFASSYDCSVWLSLPQIMGLLLIVFIIVTALIGIYLLLELGNQSGDIRFNKQGGMLMNQAQLDATKAD